MTVTNISISDEEVTDTSDQEEVAVIEKDTYRLAVVNMDWNYVKAVNLYVVFNSFVPPNGMIKSVAVYPTQFGLQRMKEEDIRGPVLSDIEDEKSDEDNNEKLRAYQKSMMRTTEAHIYKECNALEFLSSPLDLRFIPDIWEFKLEPRDAVTEVPRNYVVKDFCPRALQHSKVDFTWDDDELMTPFAKGP
ncbi:hypothetical protein P8452_64697 [Trifolium repens]|nr:hypothetical protein P8452_64697 [Trifolium repens]